MRLNKRCNDIVKRYRERSWTLRSWRMGNKRK